MTDSILLFTFDLYVGERPGMALGPCSGRKLQREWSPEVNVFDMYIENQSLQMTEPPRQTL